MSDAQAQLEKALLTTYYANLLFLSRYDKKLYDRIDHLSKLIDDGKYEERFVLEFIQEEGDFDIFDLKHERFLYDRKPKDFTKKALSKVHADTKGSFTILDKVLYKSDNSHLEYRDNIDQFDYASEYLLKDVSYYRNALDDDLSSYEDQKFNETNKFMFIGTLLGRHIIEITKKLKPRNFFVCEHNLEIFRLSLFVFDYTLLVEDGRTVVFSIMDDEHEFKANLEIFLKNRPYYNYNIKYYTTDYNVKDYFNPILDGLLGQKSTTFNHHMMLKSVARNGLDRLNKFNILQLKGKQKEHSIFKEKPVLYVGAGPSLIENIQWIKQNENKFIIVAMGASYKKLLEHGVVADVVSTLDPEFKILDEYHFDNESLKKIPNSIIFASTNTNDKIIKKFNKENLYLYEIIFPVHSTNLVTHGYSVGEIVGTMLIQLGVKDMYLVGIDLALNQETGETHISGYDTGSTYELNEEIEDSMESGRFSLRSGLIEVKGNTKDKVLTTRLFSTSLSSFSHNLNTELDDEQTVYNIAKNGAYIDKSKYIDVNDIDTDSFETIDKTTLKDKLNTHLKNISKDHLSTIDKNNLKKEDRYLKSIKLFLEKDSKPSKSFKEFFEKNEPIFLKLYEPEEVSTFTRPVFTFYLNSVLPYIFYHFNHRKLKKEKSKIKEVEEILYKQLIYLIDTYRGYIQEAIK